MCQLLLVNLTIMGLGLGCVAATIACLHLAERATSRVVARYWGWRGVLATGWLGVPLHELSHIVAAALFGHRIVNWSLLDPDPQSGTLGYVHHAYKKRSAWQLLGNFWIGVAPVVVGSAVLMLLFAWMSPHLVWRQVMDRSMSVGLGWHAWGELLLDSVGAMVAVVRAVWRDRTLWLPVQLYLAVAVTCHMAPSKADMQSATGGAVVQVVLCAALTWVASLLGVRLTVMLAVVPVAMLLLIMVSLFLAVWALIVTLTRTRSSFCRA